MGPVMISVWNMVINYVKKKKVNYTIKIADGNNPAQ